MKLSTRTNSQIIINPRVLFRCFGIFSYLSVDVLPDISVHDETAFVSQLTAELQPLVLNQQVVIVVNHNFSEIHSRRDQRICLSRR